MESGGYEEPTDFFEKLWVRRQASPAFVAEAASCVYGEVLRYESNARSLPQSTRECNLVSYGGGVTGGERVRVEEGQVFPPLLLVEKEGERPIDGSDDL